MKNLFFFALILFTSCFPKGTSKASNTQKTESKNISSKLVGLNGIFATSDNGIKFTLKDDTSQVFFIDTSNYVGFDQLNSAVSTTSHYGQLIIGVEFNEIGTKRLEQLTTNNLKKALPIIIDNQVVMAPIVQEKIAQGRVQIQGNFTIEEITNLVAKLNSLNP